MKRIVMILLAVFLVVSAAGCGSGQDGDAFVVVCTNFPLYDWAREVTDGVDGVSLVLLADGGRDLHSFEPSAKDMMTISSCKLFFGVGGISEMWLSDYLKTASSKPQNTLLLTEALASELLTEPQVTRDGHHEDDGHVHGTYDEHLWLSPRLAKMACEVLCAMLVTADAEHKEQYEENYARYAASLDELSNRFAETVSEAENKTAVFADRYPFCYLFHDYGLAAFAAFPGCSSESEASFETVTFLVGKVEEMGLSHLAAVQGSDMALAETVAATVDGKKPETVILDSLETVYDKETESYLERMILNVEALQKVLAK